VVVFLVIIITSNGEFQTLHNVRFEPIARDGKDEEAAPA
jgi:hypothetical protein